MSNIFNSDKAVIFEGIKGSGKSTQIQEVYDSLTRNYDVQIYNSEKIYPAIAQFRPKSVSTLDEAVQESLFFRFHRWMTFVNNQHSEIALIDRFVLSDLVYFEQRLESLNLEYDASELRKQMLYPLGMDALSETKTVLIDCDPLIAKSRVSLRARNNFDFDAETYARHKYLSEIENVQDCLIIDATKEKDIITSEILRYLL